MSRGWVEFHKRLHVLLEQKRVWSVSQLAKLLKADPRTVKAHLECCEIDGFGGLKVTKGLVFERGAG